MPRIVAGIVLLLGLLPSLCLAQDDWGLTRERPRPGAREPRARPRAPRTSATRAATTPVGTDRGQILLDRYLRVLEADPVDGFALDRLLELYRERDGTIDPLIGALEARIAAEPAPYAPRMILGHVLRRRGRFEEARVQYEAALGLRDAEALPRLALARILRERGDPSAARARLEEALERARAAPIREEVLRQLAALALDRHDLEAARSAFDELARGAGGGLYVRSELARTLASRSEHAAAIDEYRRIARARAGDRRALAPVLVEQARAELAAGRIEDAIATLDDAIAIAGASSGTRAEAYELLLEGYRRAARLEELVVRLERAGGSDGAALLGRVHDELGHDELALAAYRRALRARPRDVDLRLRIVQVLARSGRIDEVIAEQRALVRAVPAEPRYLVELAELLHTNDRQDEALATLEAASRRSHDPALHERLAELYARWGDAARAEAELDALVRLDPGDPIHLVALGAQRFAAGDREGAIAAWRRTLDLGDDRSRAHCQLGAILADHDLLEEAIAEHEEAVRLAPDSLEALRGLATALERDGRDEDAETRWREVLSLAGDDRAARREARERIVGIWARGRALEARALELRRAFAADPPDLESAHLLAEVERRRRDLGAAERVLARLGELDPRDVDTLLALERVRTQAGDLAGAIAVLRRLLDADPRRASSHLARMAEHALALYRDEEALGYAREAVERNPEDAAAHRRLGDLSRSRQDAAAAIASYRRALELDDRLFDVAFELSEMHLARGEFDQADAILRGVIARAPDDDLVARAARASMQIHVGAGTLDRLEHELLPLALAHPERPVYRRVAVELYDAIAAPLLVRARRSGPEGVEARAALRRYGARALKPLLEALHDEGQRGIALAILGPLGNPAAAAPLLGLAEREGDPSSRAPLEERTLAVLAAAAVAEPDLAPRFVALSRGPDPRVRAAASFALARVGGSLAIPALRARLEDEDALVRAWAAIALGALGDRGSIAALRAMTHETRADTQAACALALGWLEDAASFPRLAHWARSGGGALSEVAILALGALPGDDARAVLVSALFDPEAGARRAASVALRQGAIERAALPVPLATEAPIAWALRVARREATLLPPDLRALEPAIVRAVHEAITEGPSARAEAAISVLAGEPGPLALGELTRDRSSWGDPQDEAISALAAALRADLVIAATAADAPIRAAAIRALARDEDAAVAGVIAGALHDGSPTVRRAALEALAGGATASDAALASLVQILADDGDWAARTRAARALGRVGGPIAEAALVRALSNDAFAFVREAAARALAGARGRLADAALARAAEEDEEEAVRAAAREVRGAPSP